MISYYRSLCIFPESSVGKESTCNAGDPGSIPGSGRSLEKDRLPTSIFLGFPGGSAGKESTCNAGDPGSIPGLGRSPGEGKGYPLQYSGLENSMDCIVDEVTKSRTQLSDFHFLLPFRSMYCCCCSVAKSCLTLCHPMDYTVNGIIQVRILEWAAFPFSRGSSQPRDQTQASHIAGGFFTS